MPKFADIPATPITRRAYCDCDGCGEELTFNYKKAKESASRDTVLRMLANHKYMHECKNGHNIVLDREYPFTYFVDDELGE